MGNTISKSHQEIFFFLMLWPKTNIYIRLSLICLEWLLNVFCSISLIICWSWNCGHLAQCHMYRALQSIYTAPISTGPLLPLPVAQTPVLFQFLVFFLMLVSLTSTSYIQTVFWLTFSTATMSGWFTMTCLPVCIWQTQRILVWLFTTNFGGVSYFERA